MVVDRELDKKYNKSYKVGKYPRTNPLLESFFSFANEFNLIFAWRTRYQQSRSFSYYSYRHDSWSSIDMCWISISSMKDIINIDFIPKSFMDRHSTPCPCATVRALSAVQTSRTANGELGIGALCPNVDRALSASTPQLTICGHSAATRAAQNHR